MDLTISYGIPNIFYYFLTTSSWTPLHNRLIISANQIDFKLLSYISIYQFFLARTFPWGGGGGEMEVYLFHGLMLQSYFLVWQVNQTMIPRLLYRKSTLIGGMC